MPPRHRPSPATMRQGILPTLWQAGWFFGALGLSPTLQAGEFVVKTASAELSATQLQAQALFALKLNNIVNEALHNGIPITLTTQLSLLRQRRWLWHKKLASWQQQHLISYHSLSDRYQLNSTSKESSQSYASIRAVLNEIEHFSLSRPLDPNITANIAPNITPSKSSRRHNYALKLVIWLEIEALPSALRVVAYASPSWRIKSPARIWTPTITTKPQHREDPQRSAAHDAQP